MDHSASTFFLTFNTEKSPFLTLKCVYSKSYESLISTLFAYISIKLMLVTLKLVFLKWWPAQEWIKLLVTSYDILHREIGTPYFMSELIIFTFQIPL